jgi:DNA-binding NarL/FixJ family response regulator
MPRKTHPRLLTPNPSLVTARERRVGTLVAEGVTRTVIAADLGIPLGTLNVDLTNLYAKLALTHRGDLTRYAATHGWIRTGLRGPRPKPR